jgi:hypothetical protein
VGILESLFGNRKERRKRRRKRAVRSTGDAAEDAAEGCTGGCCLDFVVPLAIGALAGHRVARRHS